MYRLVTRNENIIDLVKSIKENEWISMDTEADSKSPMDARPLLLQLKVGNEIFILDLVKDSGLAKYVIELIQGQDKGCIFHNAKYDLKIIYRLSGIWLRKVYDTMLAEVLINQGVGKQFYSLAELTDSYLGITLDKDIRATFENHDGNFTQEQLLYSALDVQHLKTIMDNQIAKLEEQKLIPTLELEMSLASVVAEMEFNGVLIDKEAWNNNILNTVSNTGNYIPKLKELVKEKLIIINNAYDTLALIKAEPKTKRDKAKYELITDPIEITNIVLDTINFNSTSQIESIITKLFRLSVPNTQEKNLLKYQSSCEFIKVLLEYRDSAKKSSTYGENFFELINPNTGRIHAEFNQLGTVTGRFSCNKPNLQNIPQSNEYRTPFVARPGYKIITADYSQAELRLLASVSGDPVMTKAFLDGVDLHKVTASILFGIPLEQITKDQRKHGKTLNFAVVYGTSKYGLFHNFGIPLDDGEKYLKAYFSDAGYNRLGRFIEKVGERILELKYSMTPFGRKRYFSSKTLYADYFEKVKEESSIKRQGVNFIIQGGSADIVKLSMVELALTNPFGCDKFRLLMQVHDEIVMEVKEDIVDDAVKFVNDVMVRNEQRFLKEIPAVVDIFVGDCWTK